jgi:hypothetical protein
MFGRLFGRKSSKEESLSDLIEARANSIEAKSALSDQAIVKQAVIDPMVGLKIGAQELVQRLMDASKDEKGVHVESLLATLGSIAGFACVVGTLEQVAAKGADFQSCGIMQVSCADGKNYYLGDPINELLLEGQHSVWALAAGTAQNLGVTKLLDVAEIAGYVAGTLGGPKFGEPRLPDGHPISDLPINYVKNIWPVAAPQLAQRAPEPYERVVLLGLAIQNVMEMGRTAIDPALALHIVMECAVPMAKLDPVGVL